MRNEHIIEMIDSKPLAEFSAAELSAIQVHTDGCGECRRAFEAAQVSLLLVKERAAEVFEPSPFFHTRVLATLRERQVVNESWSLSRMWRAAGALTASMAATVAALAILTFAIPGSEVVSETTPASNTYYSAEEVILSHNELADEQVSDAQIFNTLYEIEESGR